MLFFLSEDKIEGVFLYSKKVRLIPESKIPGKERT